MIRPRPITKKRDTHECSPYLELVGAEFEGERGVGVFLGFDEAVELVGTAVVSDVALATND